MIHGIGVDMVSIERIEQMLAKFGEKFEEKIFTSSEIQIADKYNREKKSYYYAKRFAAKEALAKAVGLGIGRGINFIDIEIENNDYGKPEIKLSPAAEFFILNHFKISSFKIDLSLTDEADLAQAFVIISS